MSSQPRLSSLVTVIGPNMAVGYKVASWVLLQHVFWMEVMEKGHLSSQVTKLEGYDSETAWGHKPFPDLFCGHMEAECREKLRL